MSLLNPSYMQEVKIYTLEREMIYGTCYAIMNSHSKFFKK